MAVAKRPKQKPSRSDKRKVKSNSKKIKLSPEELKERKRLKRKRKKEKELAQQGKELVVQRLGKEGEKRIRLTKKRMKELEEMTGEFKGDLPDIFKLIDDPNASADDIQRSYLRGAFGVVLALIPVMEEQAHKKKNESGAYALNALLSQGREIAADLRALQSADEVASRIASLIIDPTYHSIAATVLQSLASLRDEMEKFVVKGQEFKMRQAFQIHASTLGQFLDVSSANMKVRIEEMIE